MTHDIESLQGTWAVVDLESEGQRLEPDSLAGARIVVRGNRFTSLGMGATYEGTFQVDATTVPKRLDMLFDAGPDQGSTNHAIYELDGDTWRICLSTAGERPTRFAAEPGSGCALETLRRTGDEPEAGAVPEPDVAPERSSPAPATELEGEWTMVSGLQDGRPLAPRMVRTGRRVTRGDETTVLFGTWVYMRLRFSLDPSRVPKAIDYTVTEGTGAGQDQQGIYELDGTTLRLCVSAPGQQRPPDFTTAPGDGRLLTVWTRTGS